MPSVGASSAFLCAGPQLIQNLGPDDLYVGDLDPTTTDNGVVIKAGSSLSVGGGEDYYAISDGTSDTRLVSRGSGLFSGGSSLRVVSATAVTGFSLVNGTPDILTWTAPDDGLLHRVDFFGTLEVTSNETGGVINMDYFAPSGSEQGAALWNGGLTTGVKNLTNFIPSVIVKAGTVVAVKQASALTGGAAKVWAELWAS